MLGQLPQLDVGGVGDLLAVEGDDAVRLVTRREPHLHQQLAHRADAGALEVGRPGSMSGIRSSSLTTRRLEARVGSERPLCQ